MIGEIRKKEVLDSYILNINEINFLKGSENKHNRTKLKKFVEILNDKKKTNEEQLKAGKELWKLLFERALRSLTGDLQGCDQIFKYFEEYVDFEPLLYGTDEYYRDHILHSLWVYFLGEYFYKKDKIKYNDIKLSIDFYTSYIDDELTITSSENARVEVLKHCDEIWCLISLAHDLGYPISSVKKINERINAIIPYYGDFKTQEFILEPTLIQKEVIDSLVKIISTSINFSENTPNQVLNSAHYLSLYNSLEKYDHGILSSYLIFKSIVTLIKTPFYEAGANAFHDDAELIVFLSNQVILKAIALHTCDVKKFEKFPTFESILVILDEMEEFSRWTRAKMKRDYVNELCKVFTDIKDNEIIIKYVFDNNDLDILPKFVFKEKCKIFYNLFNKLSSEIPNIIIIVNDNTKIPYKEYTLELIGEKIKLRETIMKRIKDIKEIKNIQAIEEYIGII